MTEIFKDGITVSIDVLYLDPNNPRLTAPGFGAGGPGYSKAEALFSDETQKHLLDTVLDKISEADSDSKDPHGLSDLIDTICAKGWIHGAEPIWVWEHPDARGKYLVLEGNRRFTALKIITGNELPKIEKALLLAQKEESKENINRFEKKLRVLRQIHEAAQRLEVRPLLAETETELREAITPLLSIRHINGAKPWSGEAADMFLLKRYKEYYADKYPDASDRHHWDDDLIQELARVSSETKKKCEARLRAICWFTDFKIRYAAELPTLEDGTQEKFVKGDYFLFQELAKAKGLAEAIYKIDDNDVYLSDTTADALFKWAFKEPHVGLTAAKNNNKFHALRYATKEMGEMFRWDSETKTPYWTKKFDVKDPDSAPWMSDIYDNEFKDAQRQAAQSTLLENVVKALRKLPAEKIYEDGESIKEQLLFINNYTSQLLHTISTREASNG